MEYAEADHLVPQVGERPLRGARVAITHQITGHGKLVLQDRLERAGALVQGDVNGKTDYLIVGTPTEGVPQQSKKIKNYEKQILAGGNIQLLDEEQAIALWQAELTAPPPTQLSAAGAGWLQEWKLGVDAIMTRLRNGESVEKELEREWKDKVPAPLAMGPEYDVHRYKVQPEILGKAKCHWCRQSMV